VAVALEAAELSTVAAGDGSGGGFEVSAVELTGDLPDRFDGRLLVTESRIGPARLVGAALDGSRLIDVVITDSDLSGVDLEDASLTRVEIRDCRLSGAQFAQARLRDVRFVDCRLDGATFRFVRGERVRFERCRLDGAEFIGATFEAVAWWDCDLSDADMSQIAATRAQLHGSTIAGLRGAMSLVPVAIDEMQAPVFADHVLAALGITIGEPDPR